MVAASSDGEMDGYRSGSSSSWAGLALAWNRGPEESSVCGCYPGEILYAVAVAGIDRADECSELQRV